MSAPMVGKREYAVMAYFRKRRFEGLAIEWQPMGTLIRFFLLALVFLVVYRCAK